MPPSSLPEAPITTHSDIQAMDVRAFCQFLRVQKTPISDTELQKLRTHNISGSGIILLSDVQLIALGFPLQTSLLLKALIQNVPGAPPQPPRLLPEGYQSYESYQRLFTLSKHLTKYTYGETAYFTSIITTRHMPLLTPPALIPAGFTLTPSRLSFHYYGRTAFTTLCITVTRLWNGSSRGLYLHGPTGTGKTHLLGAFAAFVAARGGAAVYIADCGRLVKDPVRRLREALCLAFANDEVMWRRVCGEVVDLGSAQVFGRGLGRGVVWIVDGIEGVGEEWRLWVDGVTKAGFRVVAGNRRVHGWGGGENMEVFTGLDEKEAAEWWEALDLSGRWGLVLRAEEREKLAAMTGNLPALLEVIRSAPSDDFTQGLTFTTPRRAARSKEAFWHLVRVLEHSSLVSQWRKQLEEFISTQTSPADCFFRALQSCITETAAQWSMTWGLIDHRFTYLDGRGIGHCAGGLIMRRLLAAHIRSLWPTILNSGPWYTALRCERNPSVREFLLQQLALWCVPLPGDCKKCVFNGNVPPLRLGNLVFAVPVSRDNFFGLDTFSWRVTNARTAQGKQVVEAAGSRVVPCREDWKTAARNDEVFLATANAWFDQRGWKGVWEIVWLVQDQCGAFSHTFVAETEAEHAACSDELPRRPAFQRKCIPISQYSPRINRVLNAAEKGAARKMEKGALTPAIDARTEKTFKFFVDGTANDDMKSPEDYAVGELGEVWERFRCVHTQQLPYDINPSCRVRENVDCRVKDGAQMPHPSVYDHGCIQPALGWSEEHHILVSGRWRYEPLPAWTYYSCTQVASVPGHYGQSVGYGLGRMLPPTKLRSNVYSPLYGWQQY